GGGGKHLGQSALLAELWGREDGDAPPVDLAAERAAGDLVRALGPGVSAAHDLGDGGLALAAAEMALAGAVGLTLTGEGTAWWFGEDQGRYLIATRDAEAALAAAQAAGVPAQVVGEARGAELALGPARVSLDALQSAFDRALPDLMT
ncbi:MAG: AIR synthase-related protein, partial [Pseudomonadota bacterium]